MHTLPVTRADRSQDELNQGAGIVGNDLKPDFASNDTQNSQEGNAQRHTHNSGLPKTPGAQGGGTRRNLSRKIWKSRGPNVRSSRSMLKRWDFVQLLWGNRDPAVTEVSRTISESPDSPFQVSKMGLSQPFPWHFFRNSQHVRETSEPSR